MKSKLESLAPNLIAKDVNASVDFYTKYLGFNLIVSVPESGTYGWAMVQRDGIQIMFQSLKSLNEDMPSLKFGKTGSYGTLFIEMKGLKEFYDSLKGKVDMALEWRTTFYGKMEFGIQDPDGNYLIFAEDK